MFKRGWQQARVEDIAKAAGVRQSTAYNHFPGGKQELTVVSGGADAQEAAAGELQEQPAAR